VEQHNTTEQFRRRAVEGDGLFAIAYALMRLREDLCFGDGGPRPVQSPLERIAMAATELAKAAEGIVDVMDREA